MDGDLALLEGQGQNLSGYPGIFQSVVGSVADVETAGKRGQLMVGQLRPSVTGEPAGVDPSGVRHSRKLGPEARAGESAAIKIRVAGNHRF